MKNHTRIEERLIQEALSTCRGKRIKSICIGYGMTAVELDNGMIGTSAILRETLEDTCPHFAETGSLEGMSAEDIAPWLTEDVPVVKKSVALATINAAAPISSNENAEHIDATDLPSIQKNDVIGIIGYIGPVVRKVTPKVKASFIFDNSLRKGVLPPEQQKELIPQCSVVFVTGTSFVNNTAERVLSYCGNAREVIMVGPSTPLYPDVYRSTPVTILAGSLWPNERRDNIFRLVSQAAGVPHLSKIMNKVNIPITSD
jgi:uncharacterized protein